MTIIRRAEFLDLVGQGRALSATGNDLSVSDHQYEPSSFEMDMNHFNDPSFQDGFAAGEKAGQSLYVQQISQLLAELDTASTSLLNGLNSIVAESLKHIFSEMNHDIMAKKAVLTAINRIGHRDSIIVSIHPSDEQAYRAHASQEASEQKQRPWVVRADSLLAPGEIVVESIFGRLHVGPNQQFNSIAGHLAS